MIARWVLFPRYLLRAKPNAEAGVRGLQKLSIIIRDGEVEAWFLPADGLAPGRTAPLVVFAHGNGELIENWPEMLDPYRRMGMHVLLPEYRGYGRSAGVPSEKAIVDDFIRFYDLACARSDVDPRRVVLHGRSLGGGVVCALARQRCPAALVLESTFTSIPDVARRWLVPAALIQDRFDSASVVRSLDVPILIFHGTRDRVVPFAHGVGLSQCARRARLVRYECDHNDLPRHQDGFWSELARFVEEQGLLPGEIATGPRRQG
ncbi:MAG TPA: alpha/beta hydrolase [Polyangiaceae bacterium]|nr:alpha/beta hydrolase [Polyangiaceae bacterium]